MIAITGATGHLGQLVIKHLLKQVPASTIVAAVRNPEKAAGLAEKGVVVRQADYADAAAWDRALAGVDRLLLISSSEVGKRLEQHCNVIAAAKRQKVKLIAYTSLLRADTSILNLAGEHLGTENELRASGVPFVLLRNGWYAENYTVSIPPALAHGAFYGSAGEGKISAALRDDYAEAAAKVIAGEPKAGQIYELAGDTAFTLKDLAAEISRQTGKSIPYVDIPEAAYRDALLKAGLPAGLAGGLASWDVSASKGALYDDTKQLSKLLGRPTGTLAEAVRQALAASA